MITLFISTLISLACAQKNIAISSAEYRDEKSEQHSADENYKERYGLKDIYQKAVDNHAKGDARLHGTRNFRNVFHGIMYRGGGGNKYIKPKRNNENPLPTVGLKNLCEEGFSSAIYLYPTKFDKAPKSVNCVDFKQRHRTLKYYHYTPQTSEGQRAILQMVFDRITGKANGPIYSHCWNGWHASGLAAAISLKQFCGWNGDQAVTYWERNTDGVLKGYERVRELVRDFSALPDFQISSDLKEEICPQP
jgi:hypothetical protein